MKFVGISDEIPENLTWSLKKSGYIVKNFIQDWRRYNFDNAKKRLEGFKKSGYSEIEYELKNEPYTHSFYIFTFDNGEVDDAV